MSANSNIEWTEHTFNPWHGCAKVSTGCKNCYAETLTNRFGGDHWGIHAGRKFMSDTYWQKPFTWNRQAEKAGRIDRVFCASMADVFERHQNEEINLQLIQARHELWMTVSKTPHLMWLILTKRPENFERMIPIIWLEEPQKMPANLCLMVSVENQEQADKRIPELLQLPAPYRGLSVEPLVDAVDLLPYLGIYPWGDPMINWVIVGGESGPKARPMHPNWVKSLRDQCAGKTDFFFKQWGTWVHGSHPAKGRVEWFDLGDHEGAIPMKRVGKKAAGRLLDGEEWNEHPFVLTGVPAL